MTKDDVVALVAQLRDLAMRSHEDMAAKLRGFAEDLEADLTSGKFAAVFSRAGPDSSAPIL